MVVESPNGCSFLFSRVFLVVLALDARVVVGLNESPDSSIQMRNNQWKSTNLQTPPSRVLVEGEASSPPELRFDWSAGRAISPVAKRIEENQRHCLKAPVVPGGGGGVEPHLSFFQNTSDILPIQPHQISNNSGATLFYLNNQGLGSDLHTWSQAMCAALERNLTVVLRNDRPWCWASLELIERKDLGHHFMDSFATYFADETEGKHCPGVPPPDAFHHTRIAPVLASDPKVVTRKHMIGRHISFQSSCRSINYDKDSKHVLRAAAVEYLFTRVRPEIVLEARKLKAKLFPTNPRPNQMVTIHVRWGDKMKDSDPVPMRTYIRFAERLIKERNISNPHVFFMTEDEKASGEFKYFMKYKNGLTETRAPIPGITRALKNPTDITRQSWVWAINSDAVYKTGVSPHVTASASRGAAGLHSLTTLLVALEADHYVLTTDSNWSRLIDELRRSVLDRDCYNSGGAVPCITTMLSVNRGLHDW